jgi:hypothetical protein
MTLVYDSFSNRFVFYPAQASSTNYLTESERSPTKTARNQHLYQSLEIPNPQQVPKLKASQPFYTKIFSPAYLSILAGWMGILIYYLYYPIKLSVVGVAFDLSLHLVGIIMLNAISTKYEIEGRDLLWADLRSRGIFLRDIKRSLVRYISVPNLRFLTRPKYDYAKIDLGSDLKRLRDRRRKSIANLYFSQTKTGYRLRRNDLNPARNPSTKQLLISLCLFFLVEIPAEDGLCLVPPALLGINGITALIFAFIFAVLHFHKYSAANCLRLMLNELLVILIILPQYGLLTCMAGHVMYDLVLSTDKIAMVIRSIKQPEA